MRVAGHQKVQAILLVQLLVPLCLEQRARIRYSGHPGLYLPLRAIRATAILTFPWVYMQTLNPKP